MWVALLFAPFLLTGFRTPQETSAVERSQAAVAPRGWDDFPVLVWRQRHRGAELTPAQLEPFGGINVERDDEAAWARERGLSFYVGHGPGRDDLHLDIDEDWQVLWQGWYDKRDETLLVRTPCLTDPATLERMQAILDRTLAARGGDHGLGISLGDEVGLTPYGNPLDLCRSPTCEARWRAYAAQHGWPERSPTTDDVRLALGQDDFSSLGPWLARRRFHQEVVLDTLRLLAEQVRATSPGTPVGLLGLSGQTAFGGVDVPRAADFLDFLECYPVSESPELLHTREDTRSLATVFLNEDTAAGTAWQAWRHWMRGGDGLVVWSDLELEERPEHRERLTAAVRTIRGLEERFPEAPAPRPRHFAVVHDADSRAASWLKDALLDGVTWPRRLAGYQEQNGTREVLVRSWLRYVEDEGFEPGAVTLAELGPATRARFPVLILPRLLVLGEEDVRALEEHLRGGGILVVDGELGWVDRRGIPWSSDVQKRLGASGRIITAQAPSLERRFSRFESNGFLHGLLASLELGAPEPFGGSLDLPTLTTRRFLGDGRVLATMLPNLPTPAQRAERLERCEALVVHDDAYELEWLHPPRAHSEGNRWARQLPPGEPAVFLLTPKD